jgi:hypothetical protein
MLIHRSLSSRSRKLAIVVGLALLALLLVSCAATQPAAIPGAGTPRFWKGFWHGIIAPISFVVSLFKDDVRIYAFPNAGRWYDFGFMLGISGFSGGLFAGSRNRPVAKTGD